MWENSTDRNRVGGIDYIKPFIKGAGREVEELRWKRKVGLDASLELEAEGLQGCSRALGSHGRTRKEAGAERPLWSLTCGARKLGRRLKGTRTREAGARVQAGEVEV